MLSIYFWALRKCIIRASQKAWTATRLLRSRRASSTYSITQRRSRGLIHLLLSLCRKTMKILLSLCAFSRKSLLSSCNRVFKNADCGQSRRLQTNIVSPPSNSERREVSKGHSANGGRKPHPDGKR